MLSRVPLCLAAAALLLATSFAAGNSFPFALSEPGCPAVSADLLAAFATNAGEPRAGKGPAGVGGRFAARLGTGAGTHLQACWRRHWMAAASSAGRWQHTPPPLPPLTCSHAPSPAAFAPADGSRPLARDQATALACHLQPLLDRAAAGNDEAEDSLTAMYMAWRGAFKPQAWGIKPTSALNIWTANLRTVVAINSNPASRFWVSGAGGWVGGAGPGWAWWVNPLRPGLIFEFCSN